MKLRLAASFLAIILFTSAISVAFSPTKADAKTDISVAMKAKTKTLLLSMKNNGDTAVYSFEIKSQEGTIRSIKVKDWDRQKIDASTVMIHTDDKPLTKGRNIIILLVLDKKDSTFEWRALDSDGKIISDGIVSAGNIVSPEKGAPKEDASTKYVTKLDLTAARIHLRHYEDKLNNVNLAFDELKKNIDCTSKADSCIIKSINKMPELIRKIDLASVSLESSVGLVQHSDLTYVSKDKEHALWGAYSDIIDAGLAIVQGIACVKNNIESGTWKITDVVSFKMCLSDEDVNYNKAKNAIGRASQEIASLEMPTQKASVEKGKSGTDTSVDISCKGYKACFTAIVTRIVDGDTLDVTTVDNNNTIRIRLALTNTPEIGQPLYSEATRFTATLCSVDSTAVIDEDDGQTQGSYGRMISKVYCQDKILNAELLNAGLATIDTRFCNESEFANEGWAQQYGCKQTTQQTQPPSVAPSPPSTPPQGKNCDPSYPDVCIPPPPPDLDCDEIPYRNFRVLPPDPHHFDRDKDGIGCET